MKHPEINCINCGTPIYLYGFSWYHVVSGSSVCTGLMARPPAQPDAKKIESHERKEAPERVWMHAPQNVETKPCSCGQDFEYVRADITTSERIVLLEQEVERLRPAPAND